MKLKKYVRLIKWSQIFKTKLDYVKFLRIKRTKISGSIGAVNVKEAKTPLFVRGNTKDGVVLIDTFYNKYHMPPQSLKENAVIVDLGSNVGYTIAHFAYLYPKSKIYGVEMDYENFSLAKKNLDPLKEQCHLIQAAIWSKDGFVNYEGETESGFKVIQDQSQGEKITQVPAKNMNTILESWGIEHIDFLKVDIEGAEKQLLENPEGWIDKVSLMKMEIHPPATLEWCTSVLEKYDFQVKRDTHHDSALIAGRN